MVAPAWGSFQKPERSESVPQAEESMPETPKQESQPSWGKFQSPMTYQGEPDPTADEDLFSYAMRNIATNQSRIAEQVVGRYGNIEKATKDFLTTHPLAFGVGSWALSTLLGPERWERIVKGKPGQQQMLPTSEDLKQLSQEVTKGYTKPKTKGEEKFQGYTEDIASTISGRTFANPTFRNVGLNNLLIPSAANAAKNVVKDAGFSEDTANLVKAAVWTPLSLAANVNASQYAADLMNRGRQGFNPNVTADIPRYQNRMTSVSRNMLQGDPRSQLAQQQLAGIQNDIANGQTSMQDLMTRYDAINAAKRDRGLFALNPGQRRVAIRNIDMVRDAVREEIEHLGQAANPQALQDWQNGVLAFSTIHRSNAISNSVRSIAKGPYSKLLTGPAAVLFGGSGYAATQAPLIAVPASVGASALYKTGQTLYRMRNNRVLANYYWNAISAAQAENIPAFVNNYHKLNKGLEKEDKKSLNNQDKNKGKKKK